MKLAEYDGIFVRIRDTYGNDYSGRARYGNADFLECEWGKNEDGRRYRPDDVDQLYQQFGTDPEMYKYSGWNPFGTPEIYLTKNEGISCVTAWCAVENISSRKVLEKSGMQFVNT